jgi:hypothetical protein
LQWIFFVGMAVFTGFVLLWSVFKLIHVVFLQVPLAVAGKSGKRGINLSIISMIFNFLGNLFRFALRCILQSSITMDYTHPEPIGVQVAVIVLNGISIAFWIASLALIMGFWVDALHSKMRVKMATRTKVLCIAAAFFVLIMIPGLLMATVFGQFVIGATIIIIPYVLDTIVFIVVTIVLRTRCCIPPVSITPSSQNTTRVAYVNRYITIATVSWIFITIFGGFGGVMGGMPHLSNVAIFFVYISDIFENLAIWSTMMLVERNLGPFVIIRDVLTWSKNDVNMAKSDTGSSKVSSSKFGSSSTPTSSQQQSTVVATHAQNLSGTDSASTLS